MWAVCWALQPLASAETPLPVASWPERLARIEMARCLDNIDPNISTRYQLWLHVCFGFANGRPNDWSLDPAGDLLR